MNKFFTITFSLFLMMDAIGNIPPFIAILKAYSPQRQRRIIVRELLIALLVLLIFNFVGEYLLSALGIDHSAVMMSGGIILFLIAIKMIFPAPKEEEVMNPEEEPMIVPLAIPLIAGPAILATIMIYSKQESHLIMLPAIFIAWAVSTAILLLAPWIQDKLGEKGVKACERLMGLILVLLAIQMFLNGIRAFVEKCAG